MSAESLVAAVQGGRAKTDDGPWRKVPNRADRRSWGVRGTLPLGGAFRRPSTRLAVGLDPTPAQRPGFRLHGRTRYGQARELAAIRARAQAHEAGQRDIALASGVFVP